MRTTIPLSVATAVLMALSCSSGGPTVCGDAIPQQTVPVGETGSVETCFEDPGGGGLSYSASSADAKIVGASVRVGSTVAFRGLSPGQTTVTVTATDQGGKSADVGFQVLVTNQPPMFTGAITEDAVGVGRSGRWELDSLFEEPSGEEMTFEATSDFPGLIVALTDTFAYFTGASEGQAKVTLTATDPHGDKGSGTISVTIWEPEVVFVDEFDSDASLDDWEADTTATELAIVDGALVVKSIRANFYGIAARSGEGVGEFTLDLTTRLETPAGVETQAGVIWFVSDSEVYRVLFGNFDGDNWSYHRWNDQWVEVSAANSSLIALDDRYRKYSIVMYDMAMQLLVDGQVVETVTHSDFTASPTMRDLWLIGTGEGTEYDRVQLSGRPGSTSDHDTADRDRDAEPTLPHELMLTLPPVSEHH